VAGSPIKRAAEVATEGGVGSPPPRSPAALREGAPPLATRACPLVHGSPAALGRSSWERARIRGKRRGNREFYPSVSADAVTRPPDNAATETSAYVLYCTIYARCRVRFGKVAEVRERCRKIIGSGLVGFGVREYCRRRCWCVLLTAETILRACMCVRRRFRLAVDSS
jgi:hypothetical protein